MGEKKELKRYAKEKLESQLTFWVPDQSKEKYSRLADREGPYAVRMAEEVREELIPLIDRIWLRETGSNEVPAA